MTRSRIAAEITADRRRWTGGEPKPPVGALRLDAQGDAVPLLMNGKNSGLPVAGVPQSGQQAEVEPREGVQGIAQAAQRRAVLAELFADGADHRADARGLGSRSPEQ